MTELPLTPLVQLLQSIRADRSAYQWHKAIEAALAEARPPQEPVVQVGYTCLCSDVFPLGEWQVSGCKLHRDGRVCRVTVFAGAGAEARRPAPPLSQNEQAWEDLRADGGLPEARFFYAEELIRLCERIVTGDGQQLENLEMSDEEWNATIDAVCGPGEGFAQVTIARDDWLAMIHFVKAAKRRANAEA